MRDILSLRERDARSAAGRAGCTLRVVRRDGEWLARTDDARTDRINVIVESDVVVAVESVS